MNDNFKVDTLKNDYIKSLEREWENFISGDKTCGNNLRSIIVRSWERCQKAHINTQEEEKINIMTSQKLKEKREKASELITVAKPFMEFLYNKVKGSGYIVILTDKDGVVLELFGDKWMERYAESLDIVPGGSCKESIIGTTAPGVCLEEKTPLHVFYTEHYWSRYHHWTCSAAPIFSPDGELIGSLDLSSTIYYTQSHTLGFVIAAAKAIENELRFRQLNYKLNDSFYYIDTLVDSVSQGIISIDEKGIITHINSKGANLLDTKKEKACGQHLSHIITNWHELKDVYDNLGGIKNRELLLKTKKKNLKVSINVEKVEKSKNLHHYIITFNPSNKTKGEEKNNNAVTMTSNYSFDDLIYQSKKMQQIVDTAKKISCKETDILIEGESGTGKEILAQSIHSYSYKCDKPFVVVNCASLPSELIQSELFGYEDGAFTGAKKGGKKGKFELANGGTILLDEIGEMPLKDQANLLRVLQEKQIQRIGGQKNIDLDLRIIATTNRNMAHEVDKGNFRLDLYYRLDVFKIKIPPLRDRCEDVLPIADYILEKKSIKQNRSKPKLSSEVKQLFEQYHWPGNIRELENVITRLLNLTEKNEITLEELPDKTFQSSLSKPLRGLNASQAQNISNIENVIKPLEELEKQGVLNALNYYNKNISRAAKALGVTRATLYRKMKKHGIS